MFISNALRAALLTAPLALSAGAANAAPVNVLADFLSGGTSLSSLSFSYDDSSTGVLSFGDLLSFTLDTGYSVYDLAYVTGTTMSEYYYFGYNADTASFVSSMVGGFPTILTAIAETFGDGFFYRFDQDFAILRDYKPGAPGEVYYDTLTVSTEAATIPVPAAGLLLLGALGGLAAARRRKPA